jgi:hypothetical protein
MRSPRIEADLLQSGREIDVTPQPSGVARQTAEFSLIMKLPMAASTKIAHKSTGRLESLADRDFAAVSETVTLSRVRRIKK